MPLPIAIPIALGAASFLGGLFGKKKSTQTQNNTYSNTQTPTDSPGAAGLNDTILGMIRQRLTSGSGLPAGYESGGIQDINKTYDTVNQTLSNDLTARGLSDSPVAAAGLSTVQGARGGSLASFINSLPLLNRQLQNEDLNTAMRTYALQPRSVTSTGTSTGTGTATSGGGIGEGLGSMANMLAFLSGSGAMGGGGGASTTLNPYGSGGSLAALLAQRPNALMGY